MALDETKLRRELAGVLRQQRLVDDVMEIVVRHVAAKGPRGRPSGTAKFEDFDATVMALVNHDAAGQPYAAVTVMVRKEVEKLWSLTGPTLRQRSIGKNINAAVARIMRRLHGMGGYDIAFPVAAQVKSRATKNHELK